MKHQKNPNPKFVHPATKKPCMPERMDVHIIKDTSVEISKDEYMGLIASATKLKMIENLLTYGDRSPYTSVDIIRALLGVKDEAKE